jgi:predicted HTH domain antitoxin
MTIQIPDNLLITSGLDEKLIKQELALLLYEKEFLTLMQAAELAEMHFFDFQALMKENNVYLPYDEQDLQSDLANLTKVLGSYINN